MTDVRLRLLAIILALAPAVSAVAARVKVSPRDNLAVVIKRARSNTTIVLSEGTFKLTAHRPWGQGVLIKKKRGLTITGRGWDKTKIKLAANVKIGLYIDSDVRNLTIKDLHIEGARPAKANTNAIGSFSGSKNIRKVTLTGLRFDNLATAISVGKGYDGVAITGNIVVNATGTESGWGYGIADNDAKNVLISENLIVNAARHAIYQSRAAKGANVRIERNLIVDHNRDGKQSRPYCAALVCARTSSVTIAHNIVINPRAFAISVEPDVIKGWPTKDIVLFNNQIIDAQYVGLWVVTGNTHPALGNMVTLAADPPNPNWCRKVSSFHFATGKPTNSALKPPKPRWDEPDHVAELGGILYIMKDGTLDEVTPPLWTFRTCPKKWGRVTAMTAVKVPGENGARLLYVSTEDGLDEVAPDTWRVTTRAVAWAGADFMAAAGGHVYALKNDRLYQFAPGTLEAKQGAADQSPARWMGGWNGRAHILREDGLVAVLPDTLEECDPIAAMMGKAGPDAEPKPKPGDRMRKDIERALRMGGLLERNKRLDLARKTYRKTIKRYPDAPEIEPLKARLKQLDNR